MRQIQIRGGNDLPIRDIVERSNVEWLAGFRFFERHEFKAAVRACAPFEARLPTHRRGLIVDDLKLNAECLKARHGGGRHICRRRAIRRVDRAIATHAIARDAQRMREQNGPRIALERKVRLRQRAGKCELWIGRACRTREHVRFGDDCACREVAQLPLDFLRVGIDDGDHAAARIRDRPRARNEIGKDDGRERHGRRDADAHFERSRRRDVVIGHADADERAIESRKRQLRCRARTRAFDAVDRRADESLVRDFFLR